MSVILPLAGRNFRPLNGKLNRARKRRSPSLLPGFGMRISQHGLLSGTGAEVMSRIAAPMVGGMISSTVLTLAVIPALYALVKEWRLQRGLEGGQLPRAQPGL